MCFANKATFRCITPFYLSFRSLIYPHFFKTVKTKQDASKARRNEYADGSLLPVNEQSARSCNAALRRVFFVF